MNEFPKNWFGIDRARPGSKDKTIIAIDYEFFSQIVQNMQDAYDKLLIEASGIREYKGGVPTQILFPRLEEMLKLMREIT